jgi:hypothetical protein
MSASTALCIWAIPTLLVVLFGRQLPLDPRARLAAGALVSGTSAGIAGGMMVGTETGLFVASALLILVAFLMGYEG